MSQQDTFTQGLIAGMQLGQTAKRDRTRQEQDQQELEALGRYRGDQLSLGMGRLEGANQGRADLKEHRGQTLGLQRDKLQETRENHGALIGLKQQGLDDDRRHDQATEANAAQRAADARTKAAEHLGMLEQERGASVDEWSRYNPEPAASQAPAGGGLVPSADPQDQPDPEREAYQERKRIFSQLDAPTRRSILAGHRKQAEKQEATQKADLQLKVFAKTGAARYLAPSAVAKVLDAASPHTAQAFLEGLDPQTQQALAGVKPARPNMSGPAGTVMQALQSGPEGIQQVQEWAQEIAVGPGGIPKETPIAQAAKAALLQAAAQTGDIRLLPDRYKLDKAVRAAQGALLANTSPKKQTELIDALGKAKKALSAFDQAHTPARPATTPQDGPAPEPDQSDGEPPRGGREPSQTAPAASQQPPQGLVAQIAAARAANPQQPGEPDDAYKARIKALLTGAPQ